MSERRPPTTEDELIHAFTDLFNAVEPETPEEIHTTLRDAGYDPDSVAARMQAIAARAIENSPLNWRNRAQRELEAEKTRLETITSPQPRNRAGIIDAIKQLLIGLSGQQFELAAHFRNFDQATDEDLASLLAELEYLAAQQHQQLEERES